MSKLQKLFRNPNLFFRDFFAKRAKEPVYIKNTTQSKIQSKSESEYLYELTELARCFDVNSLKYKNEYIWPYLRNHFWVQLYLLGFGKKTNSLIPSRLQLGTRENLRPYVRSLIQKKFNVIDIENIPENKTQINFLFLTVLNSAEQVILDDESIYYRITDPIYEEAMKIGGAKKIEMIKVNSPGLNKCPLYKYEPDFIFSPKIVKSGFCDSVDMHKDFFSVAKKTLTSLQFSENTLMETIDWELHTRDYCIDILRKYNPKILFLNGFHYHAPWISAAEYLGILTVDVQHGIQVGWNPLYNNWYELPREGYQALPDYFWVWGQKEYDSIKKVFQSDAHKPIIGGFPWLNKQLQYTEELNHDIKTELSTYDQVFLIVLQNQKNIPEEYLKIIEESNDKTGWIIRHHPKGNKFNKSHFSEKNSNNLFIGEYFDNIALARLFEVVDVCISAGSTVAVEADYFGVLNVIFTQEGFDNYVDEITRGDFYHAYNADEFKGIISGITTFSRKNKVGNSIEDVSVQEILCVLLDEYEERKKND